MTIRGTHTLLKAGVYLYLPMMYHEEQNWGILPGIIDHDLGPVVSPINIMLKEQKTTLIKQGEPLCQVIPIYREPVSARTGKIREVTKERNSGIIRFDVFIV